MTRGKDVVSDRRNQPPPPLESGAAVGRVATIREPRLLAGWAFWLEQRPWEQGRTTLLCAPRAHLAAPCRSAPPEGLELTPPPSDLRSRVHDYGGGVVALARQDDGVLLVWVDDHSGGLWSRSLLRQGNDARPRLGPARHLSDPASGRFADGLIDRRRHRWIGVLEAEGRDQLVEVSLAGGQPRLLHRADDFLGYAALSPDGGHLCWIEWRQPAMPWDASTLHLAALDADGRPAEARIVAGSLPDARQRQSVFQPLWLPNGDLVVANDRSGHWNLERLVDAGGAARADRDPAAGWQPLLTVPEEFAMPQWVYGMRTSTWDGRRLAAISCSEGRWRLGSLDPTEPGVRRDLPLPFDDLAWPDGEEEHLIAVAGGPDRAGGLLLVDLSGGEPRWWHHPAAPLPMAPERISRPRALWFAGHGGRRTHAWFYPPGPGWPQEAPLLVKSHSGPTAMARPAFSPVVQFWTSRGWGVVDVNYGGSTGFGRAYRDRLDGGWGVVDVEDCAAAARALIEAGLADPDRIAVEGGSAGGFTTLACLCFSDVFRAGACRYAVCDPSALATDTHRFEARYLDGLIGPWPRARATYEERSPLRHADRISCPVIFFQGLQDRVVPPEHTERMAVALERRGVPVEVHRYAEEGHGFRSGLVQRQVLEATEAFFRRHLNL